VDTVILLCEALFCKFHKSQPRQICE